MQRYLAFWLSLSASLLILVGAFNLVVDPYGLFRLVDEPGFNGIKPKAGAHGALAKAYQVLRVRPGGLILGNSRSEVGFDPASSAWPGAAQPVFNLTLPGTGTRTSLQYLQHVLAGGQANKPRVVVWGVDFMDFLVDGGAPHAPDKSVQHDKRLLTADGASHRDRLSRQLRDYTEATLTLGAFEDSVQTLFSQRDLYAEDLTPLGFNPMRDYLKISADEGYWAVFRQKDIENMKSFLRRPQDLRHADGAPSRAMEDLVAVMRLCREQGIALHLLIYPYHAHLLETFRITGHWPGFEAWKRELAHLVADEARRHGGKAVPLWDFSQFNELTGEPIPARGDRQTAMRWYWEAGHFKRELGELVLMRVFDKPGSREGFGVLLSPANVEDQITLIRGQEHAYRASHSKTVGELEEMAAGMGRQIGGSDQAVWRGDLSATL